MGLNIQCPDCKRKLAEEIDLTIHIKTQRFQVLFNSKTNMTVLCVCGYTGTYDPIGAVWFTNHSEEGVV